ESRRLLRRYLRRPVRDVRPRRQQPGRPGRRGLQRRRVVLLPQSVLHPPPRLYGRRHVDLLRRLPLMPPRIPGKESFMRALAIAMGLAIVPALVGAENAARKPMEGA